MRNPVLILGSEPRIVVPLATALSERGIPVTVGTLSGNGTRFWSRSISSVFPLDCYMGDRGAFSQWVKREGFDLLLPVSDTALKLVSLEYNRLTQLATVACPSPEIVDRVLDKEQTLQIAMRCGLQVPVSYVVNNVAELDRLHRNMRFPVVAKSRDK